jgi:hypothetical protein
MGHQIIKVPDGTYAVFSSFTDTWILWNASAQELEDYYAEKAAEDARRHTAETIALVEEDPSKAYCQFAMSFEEANVMSVEGGGLDLTKPDGEEDHGA